MFDTAPIADSRRQVWAGLLSQQPIIPLSERQRHATFTSCFAATPSPMTSLPVRLALWFCLLGAFASMQLRAAVIEPPSEFLFKAENAMVAGEVTGVSADGTLTVRVAETLHGAAAPVELSVRTSPQWLAQFKPKQRVLVGYTLYGRSATRPKTLELRPEGAVILVSAGLEPALYHDTPDARAMLVRAPDEAVAGTRPWLDRILEKLQSDDLRQQDFFAAELVLREPLHALLGPRDWERIARFVNDGAAHPSARASLLAAAAAHPEQFGTQWPAEAALRIVSSTHVDQVDAEMSMLPNLVQIAFRVLEKRNRKVPFASAQRWLASGQVGLAESALLAIRRSAPEREREAAEQALARAELAEASREFLRDHLRRLAIMQDALEAAAAADKG